jgi:hypothetical protein
MKEHAVSHTYVLLEKYASFTAAHVLKDVNGLKD